MSYFSKNIFLFDRIFLDFLDFYRKKNMNSDLPTSISLMKEGIVSFSKNVFLLDGIFLDFLDFYRQNFMKNEHKFTYFHFLDERRKCPIFF